MQNVQSQQARHILQALAAFVIVVTGIKLGNTLVMPLLLSAFLALLANPLVNLLEGCRFPRSIAIIFTLTVFVVLMFTFVSSLINTAQEFILAIPAYRQQIVDAFLVLQGFLTTKKIPIDLNSLTDVFDSSALVGLVTNTISRLGSTMSFSFLILIATIFMLLEAPMLPSKMRYALGSPDSSLESFRRFLISFNRYLALKTLISMFTGLLVGVMLWTKGVNFFILWAMIAFLFNFIPNVGSIIAAVPGILLTLLQFGYTDALIITAGYVAINVTIGNIIEPNVMGQGMGLSPLVVFLSLIFWGWLLGPIGMILSVPLTMLLKIMMEASHNWHNVAALLRQGDGRP